jgi:hypothetical protein
MPPSAPNHSWSLAGDTSWLVALTQGRTGSVAGRTCFKKNGSTVRFHFNPRADTAARDLQSDLIVFEEYLVSEMHLNVGAICHPAHLLRGLGELTCLHQPDECN